MELNFVAWDKLIMVRRESFNLAGIHIEVYEPRYKGSNPLLHLKRLLKNYKTHEALNLFARVSSNLMELGSSHRRFQGIPIGHSILSFLAMTLIQESGDHAPKAMTESDLLEACDVFLAITDPINHSDQAIEALVRMGTSQLDYDRELRHMLPRTVALYKDLWPTVSEAQHINCEATLVRIAQLTLDEILVMASAFSGQVCRRGFIRLVSEVEDDNQRIRDVFTTTKQQRFVDWLSCTYSQFRTVAEDEHDSGKGVEYEQFQFNPLRRFPIIIPDTNPEPTLTQVYLIPIPFMLTERVTRGLFYELASEFESEEGNEFRGAFGKVFEAYIGVLLSHAVDAADILPEWEYGPKKARRRTVDWIVLRGTTAVLIEVKHSSIYRKARTYGHLEDLQGDLQQTLVQAVKQLSRFQRDIRSASFSELELLSDVSEFEHLIITFDRTYFANSIIRAEVQEMLNGFVPSGFHWHTVSVEEFEYMIDPYGNGLFEILKSKRMRRESDMRDFREFIPAHIPRSAYKNDYLNKISEDFFGNIDPSLRDS